MDTPLRQPCPRCQGFGAITVQRMTDQPESGPAILPVEYDICPAGCGSGWIEGPPC